MSTSSSSLAQQGDERDALLIYDWDDTLCPSGWMQSVGLTPHTSPARGMGLRCIQGPKELSPAVGSLPYSELRS